MKKIKAGKINNQTLVEYFATDKEKENFIKNKMLNSGNKKSILNRASKLCKIEDLGQGNYIIHKVFNIKKKDPILPLTKGISKYLTPIILSKLLYYQDKNYKITLPFLGWAKKFEIVNGNYPLLKYNQKQSSQYLNIDEETMYDYFERMDECIKYHIEKCLSILGKGNGIDVLEYYNIKIARKFIRETNVDKDGVDITCGYINKVLNSEEIKFVIDCENKAKSFARITDSKEKFYGHKSLLYKDKLRSLLKERDILFTYNAYNIFCKNPAKIKEILNNFEDIIDGGKIGSDEFIKDFNEVFIDYIENKATLRKNREIEKLNSYKDNQEMMFIKKHRITEKYITQFKSLSELTIAKDTRSLEGVIKTDRLEDLIEQFNINIINEGTNYENSN